MACNVSASANHTEMLPSFVVTVAVEVEAVITTNDSIRRLPASWKSAATVVVLLFQVILAVESPTAGAI